MTKWGIFAACAAASAFASGHALAQDAHPATDPLQSLLQPVAEEPFAFIVIPAPAKSAPMPVPDEPVSSTVRLSDVELVQAPPPSTYQPEGTTADLMDNGKRFDINCRIDETGEMAECEAGPNNMADQKFVEIALNDVSQTVVGPIADDGAPTAGRTLVVTCQFKRAEGDSLGALALAESSK